MSIVLFSAQIKRISSRIDIAFWQKREILANIVETGRFFYEAFVPRASGTRVFSNKIILGREVIIVNRDKNFASVFKSGKIAKIAPRLIIVGNP